MKIIIATGGTGGHLFPALKIAGCLREKNCDIIFVGSFGFGLNRIEKTGIPYVQLDAKGVVSKTWIKKIIAIFGHIKAIGKSIRIIREFSPDVIVGFGGYGAFPVVFAGWLLRKKTIIHEQNVIPGRANNILGRLVSRIAVSFEKTKGCFPKQKVVLTGCPNMTEEKRVDLERVYSLLGLDSNKKTILIFGGSQGSVKINEILPETINVLQNRGDIQVFHITGKDNCKNVEEQYKKLGITSFVCEFFNNMNEAYAIADLVVCRSGALTVTELISNEKPSLLIPYPYANSHQKENAKVLSELGLAEIIEENELSVDFLNEKLSDIMGRSINRERLSENFKKIQILDAEKKLTQEIINL